MAWARAPLPDSFVSRRARARRSAPARQQRPLQRPAQGRSPKRRSCGGQARSGNRAARVAPAG